MLIASQKPYMLSVLFTLTKSPFWFSFQFVLGFTSTIVSVAFMLDTVKHPYFKYQLPFEVCNYNWT